MKNKSYTTGKICCKNHKSIITVKQIKESFESECNDCGKIITGKKEVTEFLLQTI